MKHEQNVTQVLVFFPVFVHLSCIPFGFCSCIYNKNVNYSVGDSYCSTWLTYAASPMTVSLTPTHLILTGQTRIRENTRSDDLFFTPIQATCSEFFYLHQSLPEYQTSLHPSLSSPCFSTLFSLSLPAFLALVSPFVLPFLPLYNNLTATLDI